MTQTTKEEELVKRLKKAADMEGLLFVPHPDYGGWKTTRALSPEIVAFTNKEVDPQFFRLSIEYREAGIPDENDYIPEEDEYWVVALDEGYQYGEMPAEAVFSTLEEALERVSEIMIEVEGER